MPIIFNCFTYYNSRIFTHSSLKMLFICLLCYCCNWGHMLAFSCALCLWFLKAHRCIFCNLFLTCTKCIFNLVFSMCFLENLLFFACEKEVTCLNAFCVCGDYNVLSKAVLHGCHFALHDMSNAIKRSVTSTYLNVPEPFIASDNVAASMYPWRAFISKYVYKSCFYLFLFIYKLRTQCHTIIAETVQNSNRHWRRPTQVFPAIRRLLFCKQRCAFTMESWACDVMWYATGFPDGSELCAPSYLIGPLRSQNELRTIRGASLRVICHR